MKHFNNESHEYVIVQDLDGVFADRNGEPIVVRADSEADATDITEVRHGRDLIGPWHVVCVDDAAKFQESKS